MAWEAVLAAAAARVPVIIRTEHNPVPDPLPRAQRMKMRWVDHFVDHVAFVSKGVARSHFEKGGRRVRSWSVIPNGVDVEVTPALGRAALRDSLGLPRDALLAVMLGRLEMRKGPLDFVKGASKARQAGSQAHFIAIGDGPSRPEVERLIADLGMGDRVHLMGHRTDATALLPACDIFVQPSHYEGLSIAMLEALAAGLPMVSTRVAGLDEALIEGEGALVCDIGDIDAIAAHILTLERDADLRARLGRTLQEHVRANLTKDKMAQVYEELYADLSAGRAPRGGSSREPWTRSTYVGGSLEPRAGAPGG